MNEEVRKATEKADSLVCKRLKFVFKIIKAVCAQPNTRNRQAHVYILEVLDAVGDWSGNYNKELAELLEDDVFPQICVLISTFNREEFNVFQAYFGKYLLKKWNETSNFAVLDFLGDIYGFITRVAPFSVVEECVEVFSQDAMPIYVHVVILPAILRNITGEGSSELNARLSRLPNMNFLRVTNEKITDHQRVLVKQFWTSFANSTNGITNFRKSVPVVTQCIVTSSYLQSFTSADLIIIIQDLLDWGSVVKGFHLDLFLIISTIFLSSCWPAIDENATPIFHKAMKNLLLLVCRNASASTNKTISGFSIRIIQRISEQSEKDLEEVLQEMCLAFDLDQNEIQQSLLLATPDEEVLSSLEKCVNRVSTEPAIWDSESSRKRLRLIINDLNSTLP